MHQQIRLPPTLSPPDLEGVLKVVADAGFNILAVGGSNIEHGGEFGFAVADDQEQAVVDLLKAHGYKPRIVDVLLCLLNANEPGQLLACVRQAAAANKPGGRAIQDIAIGVPDEQGRVPVQIYSARRG